MMEAVGEVFISYSHDDVNHVRRVLELSNKLRSEGIDCILDQYETSPPEGWPRWMNRKIRDANTFLLYAPKRITGESWGKKKQAKATACGGKEI